MCGDDYEWLEIADNMRTVIELTHFFTMIVLPTLIEKG